MFVFSNLATSIDGKIATRSREHFHLGTPDDRRQMQVLRRRADVVVFGASTLRTAKRFCGLKNSLKQPANAVLSSRLEGISPNWPFFKTSGVKRILFVTEKPDSRKAAAFSKTCEIVQLRKPTSRNPLARQLLRELEKRGMEKVLVEGGGSLMWDFVSRNLIDEINVTLTPKVVGGTESPTLVDGSGFRPADILSYQLKKCRRVGDELYLVYSRA